MVAGQSERSVDGGLSLDVPGLHLLRPSLYVVGRRLLRPASSSNEHSITAGPPPPPFHGADFLAPAINAGTDEIRTATI
ncbi:hypothetical protein L484_016837 [Morus notabilis]|uniref:Uncharacterized protein n=1 Tax=Morus notabilis TaxID=981085 RepID=W9QLQ5_9ROSA|nr:hypothetical protein L484_016837 [Morus notabilis]